MVLQKVGSSGCNLLPLLRAPEVILGLPYDQKIDLWLGILRSVHVNLSTWQTLADVAVLRMCFLDQVVGLHHCWALVRQSHQGKPFGNQTWLGDSYLSMVFDGKMYLYPWMIFQKSMFDSTRVTGMLLPYFNQWTPELMLMIAWGTPVDHTCLRRAKGKL
jgi:hypothetical protein